MIFFGHLGLTTGVIKTYEEILNKDKKISEKPSIDYRFVLVGSILPDIIDKPIGAGLFRGIFHNSRIFAHTLLFSVLLICIGLLMLYKQGKNNIFILGVCSSIHLILDSMWQFPAILFWPYFGWKFPVRPEGNWVVSDIIRLITDPSYYMPELIGFIIIVYYFIRLIRNKQLEDFIKKGIL
ncbi:metal-dependent hydrolase [Candidatus Clostridium radicumherbarum]|uniref:Metal-dependent hydrolase n=1 Tax=Candidatus Clostridium radicumherbarum TaxID=3381662 RepID=A0ABW8TTT3_9CLOT